MSTHVLMSVAVKDGQPKVASRENKASSLRAHKALIAMVLIADAKC